MLMKKIERRKERRERTKTRKENSENSDSLLAAGLDFPLSLGLVVMGEFEDMGLKKTTTDCSIKDLFSVCLSFLGYLDQYVGVSEM